MLYYFRKRFLKSYKSLRTLKRIRKINMNKENILNRYADKIDVKNNLTFLEFKMNCGKSREEIVSSLPFKVYDSTSYYSTFDIIVYTGHYLEYSNKVNIDDYELILSTLFNYIGKFDDVQKSDFDYEFSDTLLVLEKVLRDTPAHKFKGENFEAVYSLLDSLCSYCSKVINREITTNLDAIKMEIEYVNKRVNNEFETFDLLERKE